MKKNRTIIISLLLIAALALGIGYAAVTGHLVVNGVVTTQAEAFLVQFTKYDTIATKNDSATIVGTPGTLPDKTVSFTVSGLATKGDFITGQFTIKNNNGFTMYLEKPTIENVDSNIFTVTTSWDSNTDPVELAAGAETTIDVTVTLDESCDESIKQYFTITIVANSENP